MRPLSAVILVCSATASLTSAARLGAQAQPVARVLSGVVTDSARAPVPGAEVRLLVGGTQAASAYTGDDGRYSLSATVSGAAGAGATVLTVRRLGFATREVPVRSDRTPLTMDVMLVTEATTAPTVNVVEDPSAVNPRMAAFHQRRRLARGGYFLDHAEIEKKRVQRVSDVIRGVPGVTLLASGRVGSAVRFRNCQPMVWVDGVRNPGAELDETVGVNDIGALEIYVSPATVPAQYRDLQNPCGSVLVWTR